VCFFECKERNEEEKKQQHDYKYAWLVVLSVREEERKTAKFDLQLGHETKRNTHDILI
jgi:hypothetical protein